MKNRKLHYYLKNNVVIACDITNPHDRAQYAKSANRVLLAATPNNYVLTITFTGINYQFGDGQPLLFKLTVRDSMGILIASSFYSTYAEALEAHKQLTVDVLNNRIKSTIEHNARFGEEKRQL